ncbi:ankyrin repeat domain-containing protein [Flavobacterium sp.]|uniref:ankyrin repeat domain-containing protein n=1 Tax=Flavobacterium sp. TaxID=239 RepID=UPI003D14C773
MDNIITNSLKNGLNAQDINGKTSLIWAVRTSDIKTVKELLALGADTSIVDNVGESVLHYATRQNNLEILNIILDTNVDINLKSEGAYKQTAIFTPAEASRIPVLKILLERGANPDIQDKYKMTPLQWAAQQGKIEAVKTLLEFGASVNTKNHKGVTTLMSATIKGITECVQILIEAGAEINSAAKDGFTELMYAAYYGNEETLQYLLISGANKDAVSKKGETALSIAKKKNFNTIITILESSNT